MRFTRGAVHMRATTVLGNGNVAFGTGHCFAALLLLGQEFPKALVRLTIFFLPFFQLLAFGRFLLQGFPSPRTSHALVRRPHVSTIRAALETKFRPTFGTVKVTTFGTGTGNVLKQKVAIGCGTTTRIAGCIPCFGFQGGCIGNFVVQLKELGIPAKNVLDIE